MIRISVLGSGSSGNATLITNGKTSILVDAGLSAKQICLRMKEIGQDPDSLDAVMVTHEHGDHISGLDVFCKTRDVPVFCTRLTRETLGSILKKEKRWHLFETGTCFEIGGISVTGFKVPHDAVDPVGFRFEDHESRIGLASDIGQVTHAVRDRLSGCDTLFLEANYDENMLAEDVKRPWSTKQRIASRHGHLSNTQCAAAAVALATCGRLRRVILGHLSSDCNSPETAKEIVGRALHDAGHRHIHVLCAMQHAPTPLVEATPNPVRPTVPSPIAANSLTVSQSNGSVSLPSVAAKSPSTTPSRSRPRRKISEYTQAELF